MDLVCATMLRDGKADCVTSPAVLACSTWTALVEVNHTTHKVFLVVVCLFGCSLSSGETFVIVVV